MTSTERADNNNWPDWLDAAWCKDVNEKGAVYPSDYPESDGTDRLVIKTLEGDMLVEWGDYIIQGVQGELYPCKPDIFMATYEEVV